MMSHGGDGCGRDVGREVQHRRIVVVEDGGIEVRRGEAGGTTARRSSSPPSLCVV